MKRALVVAATIVLVLSAAPSTAGAVLYTFSGANGLAGTFTLDENTPFTISVEPLGAFGTLVSPLNHISGVLARLRSRARRPCSSLMYWPIVAAVSRTIGSFAQILLDQALMA
jgi:hypothetical protein